MALVTRQRKRRRAELLERRSPQVVSPLVTVHVEEPLSLLQQTHGMFRTISLDESDHGGVIFEQIDVVPGVDGLRLLEGHFRHSQT